MKIRKFVVTTLPGIEIDIYAQHTNRADSVVQFCTYHNPDGSFCPDPEKAGDFVTIDVIAEYTVSNIVGWRKMEEE